jgi:hypothetical protein
VKRGNKTQKEEVDLENVIRKLESKVSSLIDGSDIQKLISQKAQLTQIVLQCFEVIQQLLSAGNESEKASARGTMQVLTTKFSQVRD